MNDEAFFVGVLVCVLAASVGFMVGLLIVGVLL